MPNVPPVGSNNTITIAEDSTFAFTDPVSIFGFSDTDGGAFLSVRIDTLPSGGRLYYNGAFVLAGDVISFNLNGSVDLFFVPYGELSGTTQLTFSVYDGTDFSTSPNTLTFVITPVNDNPTLYSDGPFSILEGSPVGEYVTTLLPGDPDENVDFAPGGNGTMTIVADLSGTALTSPGPFKLEYAFGQWQLQVQDAAAVDFETAPFFVDVDGTLYGQYTVYVKVEDGSGGSTIEAIQIRVEDAADGNVIIGTDGADVLTGTLGVDSISGLNGDDRIDGLGGADTVLGGEGSDRITYYAGSLLNGGNDFDTLVVNLAAANGPRPTGFDLAANAFEQAETVFSDLPVGGVASRVTHKFYDTSWTLTGSAVDRIDIAGTSSYSKITDTFDEVGNRLTRLVTYDTGTNAGGTAFTVYDLDASSVLASTTTTKTADGDLLSTRETRQDSSYFQTSYDLGTNSWDVITTSVNDEGKLLSRGVTYDNGTRIETTYETPGVTTAYTAFYWNANEETYRAKTVSADGSIIITNYDIQSDGNAIHVFYRDFFSSAGALNKRETVYDNGTSQRITYGDDPATSGLDPFGRAQQELWVRDYFLDGLDITLAASRHQFTDNSYNIYRFDYLNADPANDGRIDHYSAGNTLLGSTYF